MAPANTTSHPHNPNAPAVQWVGHVAVPEASMAAASYGECRRNHAASTGRYAYDGCGEFLKAGKDGTREAFLCAACGCHRSFHRKDLQQVLVFVRRGGYGDRTASCRHTRKRKTKITEEQKSRMRRFADKLGWKQPRRHDEEEVDEFCCEVGITRKMFKVWLSNNRRRDLPAPAPVPMP